MTLITLEPTAQYALGGNRYTGRQLQHAIDCAHSMACAYENADAANGGAGSVDWSDLDDAQAEAVEAMGPEAIDAIARRARERNGFGPEESSAPVHQEGPSPCN